MRAAAARPRNRGGRPDGPARCGRTLCALIVAFAAGASGAAADVVQTDLWDGVADAIIGKDPDAKTKRCVVADLSPISGTAFAVDTPRLDAGVYQAVIRLKLAQISNINTAPLHWRVAIAGAGAGGRSFDILLIERAGAYQEIPCRFIVDQAGPARVSLSWQRVSLTRDVPAGIRVEKKDLPDAAEMIAVEGDDDDFDELAIEAQLAAEPPIGGLKYLYMAVDEVRVERLRDLDVAALAVDKIRYDPGEKPIVSLAVRNYAARARTVVVRTVLVHDLDTVIPVDERTLEMAAGGRSEFTCTGPALEGKWGYAVRCQLLEGDQAVAQRREYFTVHDNMWAVLMSGSMPAQFTAHITRERAVAKARRNKARYRTWVESGFWAPDEFGDFTPDSENWWGGQGCYYGGVTGTKVMIEEGHKVGITFAVYSNIWGGDGPPAFEMVRRRPDWGHPSTFNVEWFERWDRNTMGRGGGPMPMHVWPITIIHHGGADEPARHHGRELIATHRMFGWDAVRYDSHAISDRNARVVGIVKEVVRAELPRFQFGYNSSVPQGNKRLTEAFRAECEGAGGIMEEGIRQFGGGGMSYRGGATYEVFARRILSFKEEARRHGGHFMAIGTDEQYPNDLLYQYIFWFAANTHMCYDWQDSLVANYAQFATRFAGLLWDLNVTTVPNPEKWVIVGKAADFLWLWKDYVHQRDLGGGRRQLIIHLINAPLEKVLYTHDDCKVPPPRENIHLDVALPDGAKVRGLWLLTPEYELTQSKLGWEVEETGGITFAVPRLRFWSTVVVDMENAHALE